MNCLYCSSLVQFKSLEDVQKSDLGKRAGELGQTISDTAGRAADVIGKSGETIAKSSAFQSISQVGTLSSTFPNFRIFLLHGKKLQSGIVACLCCFDVHFRV